jgi:hypothetical protein
MIAEAGVLLYTHLNQSSRGRQNRRGGGTGRHDEYPEAFGSERTETRPDDRWGWGGGARVLVSGSHHVREDMAPVICAQAQRQRMGGQKSISVQSITTTVYHLSHVDPQTRVLTYYKHTVSVSPGVGIVTLVAKDAQGRPLV